MKCKCGETRRFSYLDQKDLDNGDRRVRYVCDVCGQVLRVIE